MIKNLPPRVAQSFSFAARCWEEGQAFAGAFLVRGTDKVRSLSLSLRNWCACGQEKLAIKLFHRSFGPLRV